MVFDVLIVGCGLSGAVIARELAQRGKRVEIWERRNHIGGNMYDYRDGHGILVQKYGPHTFHTKEKRLYDYMCRFSDWQDYRLTCGAEIDGKFTPTPFNFQTIDDFYPPEEAVNLKACLKAQFGDRQTATVVEVLESPNPTVRAYAEFLFRKDYAPYTAKQWGVSPAEIDVSVLKRVPLRFSYDVGYFDDPYQVMPAVSFTRFFESLLLNGEKTNIPIVYTGALDELFGGSAGRLPYRSLRFEWAYEERNSRQNAPVVAYPQAEGYTRITEYKKLPIQQVRGTSYALEYPLAYRPEEGTEPYYPVPTAESQKQYDAYALMAGGIPNLYCCGRLADFKYYNMDQALERALAVVSKMI